ncbi:MAG: diaminopimelate decarboxylase [Clostridiales bacterium]|jgi:diaminopimelate decarboxylase|nr:diaminopimelate decarboxylase [Clostridiales bacterium]
MKLNGKVTDALNFFQGNEPHALTREYGSPLYVYNERIFRKSCRDIKGMCEYPKFFVNYSVKANSNLTLLKIAREEGLRADATSQGEAVAILAAGYQPEEIFYVVNNVSAAELNFAVEKNITVSVDSLSQLETFGQLNPGKRVSVRLNPGIGAGHHEKVVTGGDRTKFGVNEAYIPDIKRILEKYDLKLAGINQHIGSLIMDGSLFLAGVQNLLKIARQFDDLDFIDLGGGFGVPYQKQEGEEPLDIESLGKLLSKFMHEFSESYGKELRFMVEPGRYIPAESGVLLGTVHAIKNNGFVKYAGTDLGFSVFARPMLYDAHHDIEVYRDSDEIMEHPIKMINIVGNMCESGDYIARERYLPALRVGDVLGVLDAGAYGYAMSSQYNYRARPAEVLICEDGTRKLIRRRDTYEDMLANMIF